MRPTFPNRRHATAGDYFNQYATELATALASIDRAQLDAAVAILTGAHQRDATIFCCGNGGSASIANHMVCDHQKGVSCDTSLRPRVISLSSNVEVMTAVTNDIGFADVFAFPLRIHGRRGDVLVAVSSSGKSDNIIRALKAATELGMETIALTGFDGGDSRKLANATIHVDGWNYGVIEDAHQACMHILAQYLRHQAMPEERLSKCRF